MNITELAALAGVSKAAVSRYFNNGYLSPEKRAAIEAAVQATGYAPSEAARGLRTRRTRQVGVVMPRLSSESTARVVDGISLVLADKGYRLLLANTANRPEREVEYLDTFRTSGVDGVIFLASIFTPEHRAVLKSMHIPVVIVAQQYEGYNCVYHDDLGAAKALTELLLRRSGSRPAYIGVTARDRAAGWARREGYVQALKDAGLAPRADEMRLSGFHMEEGYEQAKALLADHRPGSIFCATDAIAIGAMQACREAGLQVGKDVLVAGVGDSAMGRVTAVGLTSAHLHYKTSGQEAATKEEVKQAAAAKAPWYKQAVKTLGDVFVPIIPAIVASGLLMGLLEGLANVFPSLASNGTYTIIHLFSNASFVFLPILIATSAAKVFGGNIYLGSVIGMIMIHTDLVNAWNVATAESIPTASAWFGLYDIELVGYQGHVIPVIIAVWLMCTIEKKLHKIVPEMIDLFVTPLVSVVVTGYVTLTVIGPIFGTLENWVLAAVQTLITLPFGLGAALCGAIYAPTVVAGVHHMYNALEAGMLSSTGANTWMPIASAANVAQGAAALAFALRTRDAKQKNMALPASLSAFLGITEPAIFGVNLRFVKPFAAGIVGGAAGALVAGWLGVAASAYGITGVFGILITTSCLPQYLISIAVAFVVAFALTCVLYSPKKESK